MVDFVVHVVAEKDACDGGNEVVMIGRGRGRG